MSRADDFDHGPYVEDPCCVTSATEVAAAEVTEGRRGGNSPRAKKQRISVEEIAFVAAKFGAGLLAALEAVLTDGVEQSKRAQRRLGILSFFLWVARSPDDKKCRAMRDMYRDGSASPTDGMAVVSVTLALSGFYAALLAAGRLKPSYCHNLAYSASIVLVLLGRSGIRGPKLPDNLLKEPTPQTSTHTLGALGWPEVKHLDGAQSETVALCLTRADALAQFRADLAVFEFGLSFGAGREPASTVNPSAWKAVCGLLLHARATIADWKPSEHSGPAALAAGQDVALRSSNTWAAAGMPEKCVSHCFQRDTIDHAGGLGALALRCLSTSIDSVLAAAVVIACDTGFNRAPIFRLPVNPVAFRTKIPSAFRAAYS